MYEEIKDNVTVETSSEKTTPVKQVCNPGKIFTHKCNLCKCSLDGFSAVCTEKACVDNNQGNF